MTSPLPRTTTRVARAHDGEHSYFGHRVFEDLLGTESVAGLMWLSVGGARVSAADAEILDAAAVCMTAADPRVWPLKIARLAASYGSSAAGIAAATAMTEEATVGAWNMGLAAKFLSRLHALAGPDAPPARMRECALDLVRQSKRLPGFGVPFRAADERMVALQGLLEARGWNTRPFQVLRQILTEVVRAERGLEPNIGAGMASVLLDVGLDPDAAFVLTTAMSAHMFVAHAAEGAAQASPDMRRLPEGCVEYQGRAPRLSPRAEEARARAR